MHLTGLEVDVHQVEAAFVHVAVATVSRVAIVGFQGIEVAAPGTLGAELEALAGVEVTNGIELAFGIGTPFRLVDDRDELHNTLGFPVPVTEFLTDHVQMLGILLVFLNENSQVFIVEGDVVITGHTNLDVIAASLESGADDGLVNIVRVSGIDGAGRVGFGTAHAGAPIVVGADLELVVCGNGHILHFPDVTGDVGHIQVGIPGGFADGADEGPHGGLCRRRRYVTAAFGEVCHTVGRIEVDGVDAQYGRHVATALGHHDGLVESEFTAAQVVVAPGIVTAELELVALQREIHHGPDFGIVLNLLQIGIGIPFAGLGRTDEAPGLGTGHGLQILELGEVDVGQLIVYAGDNHFLGSRGELYLVVTGGQFDVLTGLGSREGGAHLRREAVGLGTIGVFVGPGEVVADLEATVDVNQLAGVDASFFSQFKVGVPTGTVDVTDEGEHVTGGNGDGRSLGIGEIQDNLVETCGNIDVGTTGYGCEGFAQGNHSATIVLVPSAILAPLEGSGLFAVGGFGGNESGPHITILGSDDIVVPVAIEADDVPTGYGLGFGFRFRGDHIAHLGAGSLGNHSGTGLRVHQKVEVTFFTHLDIGAILRHGEFIAHAAEFATQVHGPILILAELEFVGLVQGNAQGQVTGTVGNHSDVVVPVDFVILQAADDRPVAGLGECRIRVKCLADPSLLGLVVEEDIEVALCAHLDVGAILCNVKFGIQSAEFTAHVHGPIHILTELEFVATAQGYVRSHKVVVAVGPHDQILVPTHFIGCDAADDSPVAQFLVLLVRAVLRQDYQYVGQVHALGRFHETVAAIVAGLILERSTQGEFHLAHDITVHITQSGKTTAQGTVGYGNDVAVNGGSEHAGSGLVVSLEQYQRVVHRHFLVERLTKDTGGKGNGHVAVIVHSERVDDGGNGLAFVIYGPFLPSAGYGSDTRRNCQNI